MVQLGIIIVIVRKRVYGIREKVFLRYYYKDNFIFYFMYVIF